MLDLLNWLKDFVKEKPYHILIFIIIVLGWYFVPRERERSDAATQAQLELLKQEIANCKASTARAWHIADSVQRDNQKLKDEKLQDALDRNKKLERLNDKYMGAMIKVKQATNTVENIKKTVSHEIK